MEYHCDANKCQTDFFKGLQKDPNGDCRYSTVRNFGLPRLEIPPYFFAVTLTPEIFISASPLGEKKNILMLLSKIVSKIQERKGSDLKSLTFSVQILELLNKN